MSRRALCCLPFMLIAGLGSLAQDLVTPVPQRLVVHSNVLNEDRVIWVRLPAAAQGKKDGYPVIYLTDAGTNVNEIGSTIDFLADADLIPALIVVGISDIDRSRDLTPSHADRKNSDGTITPFPTSGGAEKFLDFIQTELVPEVEKRYKTEPFRILAGHSLGGLFAVHALISRPNLFNACIAASPSLWWDDFRTVHQAERFFAKQKEFKKTLFFSVGNEGGRMDEGFVQLQKVLSEELPKGFVVQSARYPEEAHESTELLTHYAGLRAIFAGWQVPLDPKTDRPVGGLVGVEQHYRALSEHVGFKVSAEQAINSLAYGLLREKKLNDAVAAFQRNVELYPGSANVYDSLADGLEAQGKRELASESVQKAVMLATQSGDPLLSRFQKHLDRLMAANKATQGKSDQN